MKKLVFLILIATTLTSCEQIQNTIDSVFGNKKLEKPSDTKTETSESTKETTSPVEKDASASSKNLEEGQYATIKVSTYLYFRREPIVAEYTKFPSGSKLRHLHDGDQVRIIQKTNKCERISGEYGCWYQVKYLGTNGYVFGAFLN